MHSKAQDDPHHAQTVEALIDRGVDLVAFEDDKIKGAIRTDFILSAEIIVISLGTVAKEVFAVQVGVLVAIAILMTVGVYGLVAGIVKLDDAGLFLYCGPVLRHPAELLPAADLGGRVWLGGRSCKGGPAAPAFGG